MRGTPPTPGSPSIQEAIALVLARSEQPLSIRSLHERLGAHASEERDTGHAVLLCAAESSRRLVSEIDRALERVAQLPMLEAAAAAQGLTTEPHRLAVVAANSEDAVRKLQTARTRLAGETPRRLRMATGIYYGSGKLEGETCLLFPGQGSQYPAMLSHLCVVRRSTRDWFTSLDDAYTRLGAPEPSRLLYTPKVADRKRQDAWHRELMGLGQGAQLGLVSSLALFEILVEWGIRADVMVGHSNGEHAALIAAGLFDFDSRDAVCDFFAQAGVLLDSLPRPSKPESIIAVANADRALVRRLTERWRDDLFLAMDNCPQQLVLAGRKTAVDIAAAELREAAGLVLELPLELAYHTPLFERWARVLRRHYDRLPPGSAHTAVVSCMTCQDLPREHWRICDSTGEQWLSLVRFRETIETLYERGVRTFIEVGPDDTLCGFVADTLRGKHHLAVSASLRGRDDLLQLQHLAAELYAHGLSLPASFSGIRRVADQQASPPVSQREVGSAGARSYALRVCRELDRELRTEAAASHRRILTRVQEIAGRRPWPPSNPTQAPLLDTLTVNGPGECRATAHLDCERFPFLRDHSFGRESGTSVSDTHPLSVVPFTVSIEVLAEAARQVAPGVVVETRGLRAHRWLTLDRGSLRLEIEARRLPDDERGRARVEARIHGQTGESDRPAFEGTLIFDRAYPAPVHLRGVLPVATASRPWTAERFYRDYAFHGPAFQRLRLVLATERDSVLAELDAEELSGVDATSLCLDPTLMDCAGQLVALWRLEQGHSHFGLFPFWVDSWALLAAPKAAADRLLGRARIRHAGPEGTVADVEFIDSSDRLVAMVRGLRQRLIRFPAAWSALLVRPVTETYPSKVEMRSDGTCEAVLDLAEWSHLGESGSVWARALAHRLLSGPELSRWFDHEGLAVDWLLRRVVAKDAARRLWAEGGRRLGAADLRLDDEGDAYLATVVGGTAPRLHVTVHRRSTRFHAVAGGTFT